MTATAKNTENLIDAIDMTSLTELIERESRIERAQRNAYYEIGLDMKAIRDKGLYKTPRDVEIAGKYSFVTFEEYVEKRWEMSSNRVGELIRAADAVTKIHAIACVLPSKESHVRELLKLETDEHRAEVWKRIVESKKLVTAKVVSDQVELFKNQLEKNWYTVEEWEQIDESDRLHLFFGSEKTMNKQDNTSIEWAQWSWNPITGCKHDCPYCYARDLANRFYSQKFEPSIYPDRFNAPKNTSVPQKADSDTSFANVFTGSMADIFGRWVPSEWIKRVLGVAQDCEQWNFLMLTKFPQRVHEFGELPKNVWMGTTVDCQDRVANAEKAFAKMGGGIKWLSVEPMLTPIKFKKLDMFDWVVIGGASKSNETPAWVPPIDWVVDLHKQARDAGCAIYYKDNLKMGEELRIKEFPWDDRSQKALPSSLKYLNIK